MRTAPGARGPPAPTTTATTPESNCRGWQVWTAASLPAARARPGGRHPTQTHRPGTPKTSAGWLRDGRILLAGDAVHNHNPVGGQGMNTASTASAGSQPIDGPVWSEQTERRAGYPVSRDRFCPCCGGGPRSSRGSTNCCRRLEPGAAVCW
ncbi:FAD-dependent monooxygenase [Nonomuraea sp. NPDC048916]|uniref:FAD-dependent monooxygenase n=1 Tax=Nonomuraea sp. NPDC048916 TaxID=3154232 RepID=UPI003404B96E